MRAERDDQLLAALRGREPIAVKHLHVVAHAVHDDATDGAEHVGSVKDVTAAKKSRQALESAYAEVQAVYPEIQALKDRLQSENIALREEIDKTSMFEEIVGSSPTLRTVWSDVQGGTDRFDGADHR